MFSFAVQEFSQNFAYQAFKQELTWVYQIFLESVRVPEGRRPDYVRVTNELVDNMTEVRAFAYLNVVIRYYLTVRFPIADDTISESSFVCAAQFEKFVRTPKVYESYLYYENTLKSLDDVAEFLA
jgi:photosystem II oxygen-evolving enhancer protein 3